MNSDHVGAMLLATDRQQSVLQAFAADGQHLPIAYSPYGHRPELNGLMCLLGFNGEHPEHVTGHYLLGNGYRAFNPVLMRFNSPDSLSPFGEGGLNPYTYGLGDPINYKDPTGHIPSWVLSLTDAVGMVIGGLVGGVGGAMAFALLSTKVTVALSLASAALHITGSTLNNVGRDNNNEGMEIAAAGIFFFAGFTAGLTLGGSIGTRVRTAWRKRAYDKAWGLETIKPSEHSLVTGLRGKYSSSSEFHKKFRTLYDERLEKSFFFTKKHAKTRAFAEELAIKNKALLGIEIGDVRSTHIRRLHV